MKERKREKWGEKRETKQGPGEKKGERAGRNQEKWWSRRCGLGNSWRSKQHDYWLVRRPDRCRWSINGCEAHYADSLSLFPSLTCARALHPPLRIDPKIHARGAAAKEWSLKTHYRTLQIPHFLFASSFLLRHRDSAYCVSANQADRFETDRSYRPFNYFAISDPRSGGRGSSYPHRGPDGLVENHLTGRARPVGVVNYLRRYLRLLSFRCRYRNIYNYVT